MTRLIALLSTCLLVYVGNLCNAQSNGAPDVIRSQAFVVKRAPRYQPSIPFDATNWGTTVRGVQLLAYATNTIVESGSTITVLTVIKNGSTNTAEFVESEKARDFDLLLTNNAGKSYFLTPMLAGRNSSLPIDPMELWPFDIPVTFPTNIQPGDYVLTATRRFSAGKTNFVLESNPVKIQIKRASGTP